MFDRPLEQRLREYRYRFGQAVVFGVPVLALQWFGRSLGGEEAERWIAVLQALLAGWVVYVGAVGMLVEGILTLRRRPSADLLVAAAVVALYLVSAASVLGVFVTGTVWFRPVFFHVCVALLILWSGWRWWRLSR